MVLTKLIIIFFWLVESVKGLFYKKRRTYKNHYKVKSMAKCLTNLKPKEIIVLGNNKEVIQLLAVDVLCYFIFCQKKCVDENTILFIIQHILKIEGGPMRVWRLEERFEHLTRKTLKNALEQIDEKVDTFLLGYKNTVYSIDLNHGLHSFFELKMYQDWLIMSYNL